jgi:prevent-host-death family protein
MRTINISQDIVPVGEFKTGISKWLRSIRDRNHPIVITQNGRPAGVLITPEEYDKLVYNKIFTESINRGIRDIKSGNIFTTSELKNKIRESRKSRI